MQRILRLVVASLAVALGAPAGSAQALASQSLPPDLQQLLTAARQLAPTQIVVDTVLLSTVKGHAFDLHGRLLARDSPAEGELTVTGGGASADVRTLGDREYDSGPGLAKLILGHRWLSRQADRQEPVAQFAGAILQALERQLTQASAVTELGPVTVAGQQATAFSLTPTRPAAPPTVVDIAPDGQLLREATIAGKTQATATISTSAPVLVVRPRAGATIALSALPARQRAKARDAALEITFGADLLIGTALGLA